VNLHRLVAPGQPRRPPPEIRDRDVRDNGQIWVTYIQYVPDYALDERFRARIDPTTGQRILIGWVPDRYPRTVVSTRQRSRLWICNEGTTHRRYWTYGQRVRTYGQRECEHSIGIDPTTGDLWN
jgi:hypothetical protein